MPLWPEFGWMSLYVMGSSPKSQKIPIFIFWSISKDPTFGSISKDPTFGSISKGPTGQTVTSTSNFIFGTYA